MIFATVRPKFSELIQVVKEEGEQSSLAPHRELKKNDTSIVSLLTQTALYHLLVLVLDPVFTYNAISSFNSSYPLRDQTKFKNKNH